MKPDINPMERDKRRVNVNYYNGTKQEIAEIIRTTYCDDCRSGIGVPCDIVFPQSNIAEIILQQLRMVMVHNSRKAHYHIVNNPVPTIPAERRSATITNRRNAREDRRKLDLGFNFNDRRSFARVRRSDNYDRRKIVIPKPFGEEPKLKPTMAASGGAIDFDKLRPHSMKPLEFVPPVEELANTALSDGRGMSLTDYQKWTDSVAIYAGRSRVSGLIYTALGLTGESGEFADKLKKLIRIVEVKFDGYTAEQISKEDRDGLVAELGDVLWYVARCAKELEVSLEFVAWSNIDKLEDRKSRDKLHGSGDNR